MRLVSVLKCHAVTLVLRASPLNWALVANEENAAKAECLELKSVCFWLGFRTSILNRSGL